MNREAIAPLVPREADLRDFPGMFIDVQRLLSSETWVLGTGDEKAAAMTLWLRSWHEQPAGSLPANERMLEEMSRCKTWKKSRGHALRGWEQATDGRLYHPVVAEKVLEAWMEKLDARLSGAIGNAKRWKHEYDPAPLHAQINQAFSMLLALNPESKALRKPARVAVWSASGGDAKSVGGRSAQDIGGRSESDRGATEKPSGQDRNRPLREDRNRPVRDIYPSGVTLREGEGEPVDKSTAGPTMALNGEQQRAPPGWRKNPDAAARYGSAIGVSAHRGEQLESLVARIDAELAKRKAAHRAH